MTVKELYKKYKDYCICLYGKPLNEKTTPFSYLPCYDKDLLNTYIIKDIKITKKEYLTSVHTFTKEGIKSETKKLKGKVDAYVVKEAV